MSNVILEKNKIGGKILRLSIITSNVENPNAKLSFVYFRLCTLRGSYDVPKLSDDF